MSDEPASDSRMRIEAAILDLLSERLPGATVSPPEVARVLEPGPEWHRWMSAIRRVAVELALAGRIVILRKGKPVDPTDFKGVYRLGLPRED